MKAIAPLVCVFPRLTLAVAVTAATSAMLPSMATGAELEEVIVSARKMDESMQDVSVAVSAFSGEQIDKMIMRDVREIEGMVPNLVIDSVAVSPAGASIYIRGVGTQEVERSFDPAVGVVIDGVPLSFVNGSMRNAFDFQSIEVLRGPQGTLFGRNTTGGVINITRTLPTGELGARYELTTGTDDLLDAKAVVNFPLGDMFAGKLGFAVQQDGSDRSNVITGEEVGNADNQEFNATLLFRPNDDFDMLFTYVNYQDQNDGVPLSNRASLNTDNPVNSEPDIVCTFGFCDEPGKDLRVFEQDFYSRDLDFEWDSYTLSSNYDAGIGTVTAIFGFQETDEFVPTDFDSTPLNTFHVLREQQSEQTTAEVRFASGDELNESWRFVAGLFWVEDDYQLDQKTSITAALGPEAALFQNPFADHSREAWAIFGEAHIDLTEKFMLILGGRYTEEDKDYSGSIAFGGGSANGLPGYVPDSTVDDFFIFGQPIWVPIDAASGSESWDEFTPKVGLDYRINDDVLTYIAYSEGFRSGGFNGRNQNLSNIGPFDPEFVENWELGMKGDFLDRTLRLNVAAFVNTYEDKQEEIIEPDGFGGSNTVVRNASTVDLFGIEAEATWVANENLVFNANLGYLDAQYDEFTADINGDGMITDNSDLELRRVPEWTGGVNGTYTVQVGPGELSFFGSYRYTDEYWVEVRNDPRGLVQDRGVLDATIAYEWEWSEGRNVRVALWGRDMTDEVDYSSAVIVPGTIAFSGVSGGEQYGLRVSGNF
ncbi:MAG: TonB-dependent receptor [Gammaproteobacteria bacterium]|nr:TonB-dependent receptor [Gammaproteobacteria bacterium]